MPLRLAILVDPICTFDTIHAHSHSPNLFLSPDKPLLNRIDHGIAWSNDRFLPGSIMVISAPASNPRAWQLSRVYF